MEDGEFQRVGMFGTVAGDINAAGAEYELDDFGVGGDNGLFEWRDGLVLQACQ